uniref:Uncharacterized protein n=1 Tax=Vespula pensylvanica TaxID=30213 RepID=A0A834P1C2_VESPE|nr:hypothetical protein H0235_009132 [Vespula pensylvanica]
MSHTSMNRDLILKFRKYLRRAFRILSGFILLRKKEEYQKYLRKILGRKEWVGFSLASIASRHRRTQADYVIPEDLRYNVRRWEEDGKKWKLGRQMLGKDDCIRFKARHPMVEE